MNTQFAPTPASRAAYCDESVRAAIRTGTKQYVILGAGLDTFVFRNPDLMKKIRVFEVDHPKTQEDKLIRLKNAGLDVPFGLSFVSVDFGKDDLRSRLLDAGFDETEKTFFSLLGVSYYLSCNELEEFLSSVAALSSEGSSLLFDYADGGVFEAEETRVKNMIGMAAACKEPMKFCSGEFELMTLLEKHGFLIYDMLTPYDIDSRYFRGEKNGVSAFGHINYALAVIKNAARVNTKDKIQRTALKLFAKKGYEAVSVQEIADRLLITKGALYRHYKNKRDILDSIIRRMEDAALCRAERVSYSAEKGDENSVTDFGGISGITESIRSYLKSEFYYYTTDALAADFRKMLTVEQYNIPELGALYRKYLLENPIDTITAILVKIRAKDEAKRLAIGLYSGIFLLYGIYDMSDDNAHVR